MVGTGYYGDLSGKSPQVTLSTRDVTYSYPPPAPPERGRMQTFLCKTKAEVMEGQMAKHRLWWIMEAHLGASGIPLVGSLIW